MGSMKMGQLQNYSQHTVTVPESPINLTDEQVQNCNLNTDIVIIVHFVRNFFNLVSSYLVMPVLESTLKLDKLLKNV